MNQFKSAKLFLEFDHNYEVELNYELSGRETEKIFHFPGASMRGGKDGLLLKIKPQNAEAWFGIFGPVFGSGSMAAAGAYSCPDKESLCVVYGGTAYLGPVKDPFSWMMIAQYTGQILQITDYNLILLVSYFDILAYGVNGKIWQTEKIGFGDDLKVNGIKNGFIVGQFYDPTNHHQPLVNFKVNIASGEIQKV